MNHSIPEIKDAVIEGFQRDASNQVSARPRSSGHARRTATSSLAGCDRPPTRDLKWLEAARHFGIERKPLLEVAMNTICKSAMIAGVAFSTFAFTTTGGSSVQTGPIVPPGHYCMSWDIGGSDCSFTSYEQCLATASGLDAECYCKTLRDDEG